MADEKEVREPRVPRLDDFLDRPTHDLEDWEWLWRTDQAFPIRSHRRAGGGLVVALKRLLRPFVKAPLNDLWDRQRVFNQILLTHLRGERQRLDAVPGIVEQRYGELERRFNDIVHHVMGHNDALFARVDQKLDLYRRQAQELRGRLGGLLAVAETGGAPGLARAVEEDAYVEFENRFRGSEEDIAARAARYLPYLEGRGEVLDLGCGRGEALAVLAERGIQARGVDASAQMVERCRERGLRAEVGDLFERLAGEAEGGLGGILSLHVVEHLPAESLARLGRLAWRALAPGGVLIVETPNPLSVVVAARNFWLDPSHRRPVHPEALEMLLRIAGFDPVERLDLRPFPDAERLPELDLAALPPEQRPLADSINRLRDRLDDVLFGYQDYALVATKPSR